MLIEEDPFPLVAIVNSINIDLRALLDVKKEIKEKQEVWDTLGQPSGKFDYMVKYFKPPANNNYIPVSEIIATGWRERNVEERQIQGSNRRPIKGRSYWRPQSRSNFINRRFSPSFVP